MTWHFGKSPQSKRDAQQMCSANSRTYFQNPPLDATVFVMDNRRFGKTYQDLKRHCKEFSDFDNIRTVIILLGGGHGFDGKDDCNFYFFNNIVRHCHSDIGPRRVLRINLINANQYHKSQKLTTQSVAAFLATRWHIGGLHDAIMGFE